MTTNWTCAVCKKLMTDMTDVAIASFGHDTTYHQHLVHKLCMDLFKEGFPCPVKGCSLLVEKQKLDFPAGRHVQKILEGSEIIGPGLDNPPLRRLERPHFGQIPDQKDQTNKWIDLSDLNEIEVEPLQQSLSKKSHNSCPCPCVIL